MSFSEQALSYAFQRVEDFAVLNRARSPGERAEAVDLWLASLGLDESRRAQTENWADGFVPGLEGPFYVGLAVGLFVHQYITDGGA